METNSPQVAFRLPLPTESRQAGLAGEELLHGGLFDGSLLDDPFLQRAEQFIHIRQRLGDGTLFGERGAKQPYADERRYGSK